MAARRSGEADLTSNSDDALEANAAGPLEGTPWSASAPAECRNYFDAAGRDAF
jgi:hypothetical protein